MLAPELGNLCVGGAVFYLMFDMMFPLLSHRAPGSPLAPSVQGMFVEASLLYCVLNLNRTDALWLMVLTKTDAAQCMTACRSDHTGRRRHANPHYPSRCGHWHCQIPRDRNP